MIIRGETMRCFIAAAFVLLLFVTPAYTMTVDEAVQHALGHHPDLQALRLDEDMARGELEKAQLLLINNPTIGGSLSNKDKPQGEGGGAYTNFGVKLSQEFEIAGQRGVRIQMAQKELARVQAGIKDRERVFIADVKDAFTRGLALKKKSALAREIVQLKDELLGYTRIKFQAGEISGLDVNLAEVELAKAKRDLLLAEREYRESLLALQGLLGLSPERSFSLEGDLPSDAPPLPDRAAIREAATAFRPDARAAELDVEKTLAGLRLAKKEVIPNITLSGFYDRDEQRNAVGLEISIPIPLFDRKQAQRTEAYVKAQGAGRKSDGLKKTIEREAEQAYGDLVSATEELTLFKKEIIIKAAENLSLLNLAFKEGKVGFFEVRLAQKDTIEVQFAYIDAQTRAQMAQNALDKITGGKLK
jgi:cobalt-zinc-cadmium efflux system outer membrane protein